jgi:ribonuclease HII
VILGGKPEDWVGINDSKQLTKARRAALCQHITASAVAVAVGVATVAEIDHLNILVASRVAMGRAIAGLPHKADTALVDGPYAPLFPADEVRAIPVVDGDAKSLSIAAASIVAKVERDAMMAKLAEQYPMYGFERHVGYGTSEHLAALRQYGPTPHHRTTFGPVKALIEAR